MEASEYLKQIALNPLLRTRVYNKMNDKIKYEYAFRTLFLNEMGTKVAKELNINYYTAKNMVRQYKCTGSFNKESKKKIPVEEVVESEKETRLMLGYDEEGELIVTFDYKMSLFETENLWRLHDKIKNGAQPLFWI